MPVWGVFPGAGAPVSPSDDDGNPFQGGFDPSRPWEPFDSEVEFLLARFMVRFGVNEGAIDFLLKTILPCLGVHHAVRSVYAVKERIGRMEDGLGHQSFLGSALHAIEGFQSRRACRTISTHLAPDSPVMNNPKSGVSWPRDLRTYSTPTRRFSWRESIRTQHAGCRPRVGRIGPMPVHWRCEWLVIAIVPVVVTN
jgi:hypothetical protein